jgi:LysR family transcriptional regulator, benzoate and cis,cis-muconate-responsive activator of ben and cat genes
MHLLKHGTRLLSSRERLTNTLRFMGDGLVGDLHLGVEPMVINAVIADVLAEFMLEAPEVHVRMLDIVPNEMLDRLRAGELDLACVPFGTDQFADFVTTMFNALPVVRIPIKLAVPADRAHESHPGGYGWGRWILPLAIPAFSGMIEQVTRRLDDDPSLTLLEVSTPQTALPFVAAGLGVTPTTDRLAATYRGVTVIDAPAWLPPMHATMLWRRGIEVTPMMRRLIDVTKTVGARRTAMERRYS